MPSEGLMLEFTDHRYANNNLPGPYVYSLICIHVFDCVNCPDNVTYFLLFDDVTLMFENTRILSAGI